MTIEATLQTGSDEPISATQTLDCTGQLCPMPIYRAALVMSKLLPGQVLEVVATDPGAKADFPAFARQAGHALLETVEQDSAWTFRIRKGGA